MRDPTLTHNADHLFSMSCKRYHRHYDNELYKSAIRGTSSLPYRNVLVDDALALCGSPYHALSSRFRSHNYAAAALAFLAPFAEQ